MVRTYFTSKYVRKSRSPHQFSPLSSIDLGAVRSSAARSIFLNIFLLALYAFNGLSRHPSMVILADYMLPSGRRLPEARAGHEKTLLSGQIEATDEQIDALVRELYGLTAEEIEIVEEATA